MDRGVPVVNIFSVDQMIGGTGGHGGTATGGGTGGTGGHGHAPRIIENMRAEKVDIHNHGLAEDGYGGLIAVVPFDEAEFDVLALKRNMRNGWMRRIRRKNILNSAALKTDLHAPGSLRTPGSFLGKTILVNCFGLWGHVRFNRLSTSFQTKHHIAGTGKTIIRYLPRMYILFCSSLTPHPAP